MKSLVLLSLIIINFNVFALEATLDSPFLERASEVIRTFDSSGESDEKYENFESSISISGHGLVNISEAIDIHEVNGVSIAVIEDGKMTQHRFYGHQDKAKTIPTTENTIYQAASMTKFVAALSIIEAERLGHLILSKGMPYYANLHPDSTVDKWIDKKFKGDDADYPGQITLRRLLSMVAGLDTWGIGTQLPGFEKTMDGIILGNILDPFNNGVQPIHPPGTVNSYSGGGYTVAEHILELSTGMSSKEWFTDYFLNDLDMNKSTFEEASKLSPSDDAHLARACSRGVCLFDVKNTKVKAAGGLLSTVDDYAKVVTAIINEGLDESGSRVLKVANIEEALTPMWHRDSSLNSCSLDSDCPEMRDSCIFPSFCIPIPVEERCILNQCKEPIKDGDAYYGRGVSLGTTFGDDGLPNTFYHGGNQDGFSTYFWGSRSTKGGIVVMINGKRNWTKDGKTYGGDKLKSQILNAFFEEYL